MGLSITVQPDSICLAGNHIVTEALLQNSDIYTTIGVYGQYKMVFSSIHSVGYSFSINCNGTILTFTCATSPDDSGYQYKSNVSYTLNDWVKYNVFPYINSNYILSKYFTITYISSNEILLVAKAYTSSLANSNGAIITTVLANVIPVKKSFVGILFQICDSNLNIIYEEQLTPNSSNKAQFFAEEIIMNNLQDVDYIIANNINSEMYVVNLTKTYYIRCCYVYNFPQTQSKLLTTNLFRAFPGKINEYNYAHLIDNNFDFFTYLQSSFTEKIGSGFFTNRGNRINMNFGDFETINFINQTSYSNLTIEYIFDENQPSQRIVTRGISCNQYQCIIIHLRNSIINFSGARTIKLSVKYNSLYLASMNYIIDYELQQNKRRFCFKNSLGVFEFFNTYGTSEFKLNEKREIYESDFPFQFNKSFNNNKIGYLDTNTIIKCNSGRITKSKMYLAYDFLNSTEVYEYDNLYLVPIIITSAKGWVLDEDDDLYSFDFEYKRDITPIKEIPETEQSN